MFDKIKQFVLARWKKAVVSVGAGVVASLVLRFVIPSLLSLGVVSTAGGFVVAYLVWTRVALWEIRELAAKVGVKVDL